jgi:hypothetical protein
MVLHPLFLTQNWIEAFCVEIAIVNLMVAGPQSLDDLAMQRCTIANADWIGVQNKDAQRRAPCEFVGPRKTLCTPPSRAGAYDRRSIPTTVTTTKPGKRSSQPKGRPRWPSRFCRPPSGSKSERKLQTKFSLRNLLGDNRF